MGEVCSFFFPRDRAVFKKSATFKDLKRHLVHIDARFKGENAVVFEIRC